MIVNYRGSEEAALETVAEIKSAGGDAVCMAWDVSDYAECEKNIKQIIDTFGRIDILVNNAGITRDDLLMKLSEEDFDAVIAANLKGTFCMLHFVSRQMLRQRSGKIINLASVVGICGNAGQVNYAASKAGVIGMTKSAAKELASRNITVNAVAPGWIETDMTKNLSDAARERMLSAIPLKKPGTAKQVAGDDRVSGIRRRRLYYRSGITGRWRHADVAKKAEANLAQDSFEIAAQEIFRT